MVMEWSVQCAGVHTKHTLLLALLPLGLREVKYATRRKSGTTIENFEVENITVFVGLCRIFHCFS